MRSTKRTKKVKRLFALALSIVILLSATPMMSSANEVNLKNTGEYDDSDYDYEIIMRGKEGSLTWEKNCNTGELTINGSGTMKTYLQENPPVWVSDENVKEGITSIVIGDGITSIGSNAFYCMEEVESLKCADTVTSIGESAFMGCSSLSEISIPNVTTIGKSGFAECESLTSVNVSKNLKTISPYAFSECSLIETVTGEGAVAIGSYAFSNCSGIYKFSLPNAVSISTNALSGTENLVSVYLPKATGKSSFLGEDSAVTNLTIGTLENKALYNNEIIKTVNLTNAKSIGDDALRECTKITSVYMPLVSTVGERAFYGCTNLTNVTAPELKTAKALSFANCSNLKNTKMNKLQIIGDRAFENDSMLTEVTINNTVQSVGSKAFGNCIRLKKANLGTGLTKIGDYAFFNCYQYESTLKPLNVTSIGTKAFYNCKKMPCKTVGRKCKTIGVEAFVGCSKIASLYIPTSTTSIGKNISGNAKVNEGYSTSTTAKPNFKIYCVKNSQAYKYADKYNFIKNKKMAYAVTSISLNKTSLTLNKGKSYVLKPTYNSNASVKKVTYTTSNSKVATVSTSGKLTAKSKGSCVVSATAIDGSYVVKSCKVVVK